MTTQQKPLLQCEFLIPIHRDKNLSDGKLHSTTAWEWLTDQLWDLFETPGTLAPGLHVGGYKDPKTGQRVYDKSRKYTVAVCKGDVQKLRELLIEATRIFQQKYIYFNVAGKVEFIRNPET